MLKELQDLGLSEKEARIYLAALEIGRATADQLAKHAKIKRPTTYVQLESLMKMGLMSTYEEDKKTYFAPESPELLTRLLQKQKESISSKESELKSLLPQLLRQFESAGERPVVRFFPGKAGIESVREDVLSTKEKQMYVIYSHDSNLSNIFSKQEIDSYTDKRNEQGIRSRAIYTNSEYFKTAWVDNITEVRLLSSLQLTMDIRLFDNKVALFSTEGTLFALVIESQQAAASIKQIFEFLWEHAEKKD
jgi:HTH-type transcriptional regulator, sugar sensing transcriptional regulator